MPLTRVRISLWHLNNKCAYKTAHRRNLTSTFVICYRKSTIVILTVLPTKSDSDVIFCLHINLNTPLELTRIDRSLVY